MFVEQIVSGGDCGVRPDVVDQRAAECGAFLGEKIDTGGDLLGRLRIFLAEGEEL
jgi:hypothetical protein